MIGDQNSRETVRRIKITSPLGREITRQPWRGLVGIAAALWVVAAVTVTLAVLAVVIPLSIPFHLALKALGRRGFFEFKDGALTYDVGFDGFRKRGGESR